MEVYIEWNEGYWWAVSIETGERLARAIYYSNIRQGCRDRGYRVRYVRAKGG